MLEVLSHRVWSSVVQSDARIGEREDDVNGEIDANEQERHGQNEALDSGVIGGHQRLDGEGTDPGPGEYFLNQYIGAQ